MGESFSKKSPAEWSWKWYGNEWFGLPQHYNWLVVSTLLKNISQLGWLFSIYGKIKNVPNHQPDINMYERESTLFWLHSSPRPWIHTRWKSCTTIREVSLEHSSPPNSLPPCNLFLPRANYCKRPMPGIGRKYWLWKVIANSAISAIACDQLVEWYVSIDVTSNWWFENYRDISPFPTWPSLDTSGKNMSSRRLYLFMYARFCSSSHIADWLRLDPHLPVFESQVKSLAIWGLFLHTIYPK